MTPSVAINRKTLVIGKELFFLADGLTFVRIFPSGQDTDNNDGCNNDHDCRSRWNHHIQICQNNPPWLFSLRGDRFFNKQLYG